MIHTIVMRISGESKPNSDKLQMACRNTCTCGWQGTIWLGCYPERVAEMNCEALLHKVDELEKAFEDHSRFHL